MLFMNDGVSSMALLGWVVWVWIGLLLVWQTLISGTFENNLFSNVYVRTLNFWSLLVDLTREAYLWKSLNTTMVQERVTYGFQRGPR